MVMTHTHTKSQGQRSVSSKDRVETDRQMDGSDCIISRANVVVNKPGVLDNQFLGSLAHVAFQENEKIMFALCLTTVTIECLLSPG